MKEVLKESISSDDDEEEELENSTPQNETNKHALNCDDLITTIQSRFKFNKRRYLLVLLIVLLVVFTYMSISVKNPSVWDVRLIGSPSDTRRESELRALYLLKEQHLDLVLLLDRTLNNSFGYTNTTVMEELKGRIYQGIALNKEIQKVLLSSHKNVNVSGESEGLLSGGIDMCRKVDQNVSNRMAIEWNPHGDKYLFAICTSGQMSNHLICLEKHMFFAAVLRRVLIFPSHKVDYDFNRVLDIEHINKCVGRKVVVTFEEFHKTMKKKKKDLSIDRFICYFSKPRNCYVDAEHVKKLKGLGLSVPKLESPWVDDVKKPKKRSVKDVEDKFSSSDDVIAIGDVFYANVENDWVMQPGGPVAHNCRTLIEPSRLIMATAQRFVQTFLGKDYVALHFRRHGWLNFCNAKNPSCFFSVPQAASCIMRVVERADTPVIYMSTDAADSETGLLQSLLVIDGKHVPLIRRPSHNSAEKWDALLYRHGLADDSQVEGMVDKTICAMSRVFMGSSGSTFTEDIRRLRRGWGSSSVCDEYICQGQLPNFIAHQD